ncbi:MAG: hypothetical protein OXJ62_15610, partial [Spirochaetaceae bacterium]|nr:hypothetical protein [Spirochaetaceae bacterium]
MLTELSLSGFLAFAMAYPLCFLANAGAAIDRGFYRFNLGVACFLLSLGLFALLFAGPPAAAGRAPWLPPAALPVLAAVWLLALLAVTWSQWERPRPNLPLVALPSLLGAVVT